MPINSRALAESRSAAVCERSRIAVPDLAATIAATHSYARDVDRIESAPGTYRTEPAPDPDAS